MARTKAASSKFEMPLRPRRKPMPSCTCCSAPIAAFMGVSGWDTRARAIESARIREISAPELRFRILAVEGRLLEWPDRSNPSPWRGPRRDYLDRDAELPPSVAGQRVAGRVSIRSEVESVQRGSRGEGIFDKSLRQGPVFVLRRQRKNDLGRAIWPYRESSGPARRARSPARQLCW